MWTTGLRASAKHLCKPKDRPVLGNTSRRGRMKTLFLCFGRSVLFPQNQPFLHLHRVYLQRGSDRVAHPTRTLGTYHNVTHLLNPARSLGRPAHPRVRTRRIKECTGFTTRLGAMMTIGSDKPYLLLRVQLPYHDVNPFFNLAFAPGSLYLCGLHVWRLLSGDLQVYMGWSDLSRIMLPYS